MKAALFSIVIALLISSCAQQQQPLDLSKGTWFDLTHDFGEDTIYWVNAEPFKRQGSGAMTDKGYFYASGTYSAAEHGGTHIDSPIHFAEGRKTVDQIELSQLNAPGVKIDVTGKASGDRDYLVTVEDIKSWEATNGPIPEWSIILLYTGFGSKWPDKMAYLGTDQRGDEAAKDLHFPGLHPDAAKWLVENRKFKAIGIDTASIDYGQSTDFKTHVTLMTANIPAFENVANLDKIPAKGFHVIAMPMKIKNGSGAPLRIAAFMPSQD
jgi:kynurenine formamidase